MQHKLSLSKHDTIRSDFNRGITNTWLTLVAGRCSPRFEFYCLLIILVVQCTQRCKYTSVEAAYENKFCVHTRLGPCYAVCGFARLHLVGAFSKIKGTHAATWVLQIMGVDQ